MRKELVILIMLLLIVPVFSFTFKNADMKLYKNVKLIENTEHCISNCHAVLKICGNGKRILLGNNYMNFNFKDKKGREIKKDKLKKFNVYIGKYKLDDIKTNIDLTNKCKYITLEGSLAPNQSVDWMLNLNIDGTFYRFDKYAWWNSSYTYKLNINCSKMDDLIPMVVNGTNGVNIDGTKYFIHTMCSGQGMAVYYSNSLSFAVANDTDQIPMCVENETDLNYECKNVFNGNGAYPDGYAYGLTDTKDFSNVHNLLLDGGLEPSVQDGKIYKSRYFEPIDSTSYYLNNTDTTSTTPFYSNADRTVYAWFKTSDTGSWKTIYSDNSNGGGCNGRFILRIKDNDELQVSTDGGPSHQTDVNSTGTTVTTGNWIFGATTIDSTSYINLYVNTNKWSGGQAPAVNCNVRNSTIGVGISDSDGSKAFYFNGNIDNVVLLGHALTDAEINQTYNNHNGVAGYGTVGNIEVSNSSNTSTNLVICGWDEDNPTVHLTNNMTVIVSNATFSKTYHNIIGCKSEIDSLIGDYVVSAYYGDAYRKRYLNLVPASNGTVHIDFYFPEQPDSFSKFYTFKIVDSTGDANPVEGVYLKMIRFYENGSKIMTEERTDDDGRANIYAKQGITYYLNLSTPQCNDRYTSWDPPPLNLWEISLKLTNCIGTYNITYPIQNVTFWINFEPNNTYTDQAVTINVIGDNYTVGTIFNLTRTNLTKINETEQVRFIKTTSQNTTETFNMTPNFRYYAKMCINESGPLYCVDKIYFNLSESGLGIWSAVESDKEGGFSLFTFRLIWLMITLALIYYINQIAGTEMSSVLFLIMLGIATIFSIIPLYTAVLIGLVSVSIMYQRRYYQ